MKVRNKKTKEEFTVIYIDADGFYLMYLVRIPNKDMQWVSGEDYEEVK